MFSKSRKTRGHYPSVTFTTKAIPKSSYRQAAAARGAASRSALRLKPNFFGGRSSAVEVKSFDVSVAAPAAGFVQSFTLAAGAEPAAAFAGITELNDVRQGAAFYNRIGSKITMKSIMLDFDLVGTLATTQNLVRWALVYDRQPNAAFPAIADVFANNTGVTGFYQGVNMVNRSRFQVIRDQTVQIDAGVGLTHHVHEYCKGRWDVEFKADAGTIGDISTGSLLLIIGYTNSTVSSTQLISMQTRVRYFD
jgi:hypothetical protein